MSRKPTPSPSPVRAEVAQRASSNSADAATTRGERRKRETREKLLRAAFELFAERGPDAVPISDITEAADVGFGSFYNYFASKEAIHDAVVAKVFEEFADGLDALTVAVTDPAETLAVSIRHAITRARREPLWGKLLVRQSLLGDVVERGLGARLLRDIQRGLASKRFSTTDAFISFIVVGSSVLGAITAQSFAADGETPFARMSIDDLDARTAAAALKILGLDHDEADAVARRPLPSSA